ncbi:hypothetical protein [Streptomyces sp. NPDC055056]
MTANLASLGDRRFNGYLRIRLPHELDGQVEAVVAAYIDGSEPVRRAMTNQVNGRIAAVLSAYGQRMASVAVRAQSVDALRQGLVAVALAEGHLDDPRDNLFVLAAVNDSATMIGTSLRQLIAGIEGLLPSVGLAALKDFDQRDVRDKSIESMGIRREGAQGEFLYV